jgi:hypothetical protein
VSPPSARLSSKAAKSLIESVVLGKFTQKARDGGFNLSGGEIQLTASLPARTRDSQFKKSNRALLLLSGNDFSGYFGRSFWSALSVKGRFAV